MREQLFQSLAKIGRAVKILWVKFENIVGAGTVPQRKLWKPPLQPGLPWPCPSARIRTRELG
jgi:hypothetical protein